MTWMMDLEMLDHAENLRDLDVMKILPRKDGFEDVQRSAQCWMSRSRILCINMELRSEFNPEE